MSILSTGTSGISNFFPKKPKEKETAVILKHIDQLLQNLVRVHNLVRCFDRNHKKFIFFIFPIVFYCLSIVRLLFQL